MPDNNRIAGIISEPIAFSLGFVQNDSDIKGGFAEATRKIEVCRDGEGKLSGSSIAYGEPVVANSGEGCKRADSTNSGMKTAKKNSVSAIIGNEAEVALFSKSHRRRVIWLWDENGFYTILVLGHS